MLRSCWGYVGDILDHPGLKGRPWAHVGPGWATLSLSWAHVGPMLAYVSPILAYVGPVLPLCWPHVGLIMLAPCWPILGPILRLCWWYVRPSLLKDLQGANFSFRTPPRIQTAGSPQQNSMKLPVSKGVGLQDANAGRHFLKPLEKKLWSHAAGIQTARHSNTAWSCQFQKGCRPAGCQCWTSLSEACRKQALEPRRQRPNIRLATAKQHGAASFKGPPGLQNAKTSLSEASKKEALAASVQTAGSPQQYSMELPASKGLGLQNADAGCHFLKPVENKLGSHAASVQTTGPPQQNSMELPASTGLGLQNAKLMPDVTFWSL